MAARTAHAVTLGRLQHWSAAEQEFQQAGDLAECLIRTWPSGFGLVKLFEAEYRLLRGQTTLAHNVLTLAREHLSTADHPALETRLHILEAAANGFRASELNAAKAHLPAEEDRLSLEMKAAVEVLTAVCTGADDQAARTTLSRIHDPVGEIWILILQIQALLQRRPSNAIRFALGELEQLATSMGDTRFRAYVMLLSAEVFSTVHRPEEAVYACSAALRTQEASDIRVLALCHRAEALCTLGMMPLAEQDVSVVENLMEVGPNTMDTHTRLEVASRLCDWYTSRANGEKALHYTELVLRDTSSAGTDAWVRTTAVKCIFENGAENSHAGSP